MRSTPPAGSGTPGAADGLVYDRLAANGAPAGWKGYGIDRALVAIS